MDSIIRSAILRTLCFYAAWEYAPTHIQCLLSLDFGLQNIGSSLPQTQDISKILNALIFDGTVARAQGRVCLAPHADQITRGRENEFFFARKLRQARRAAAYIGRLPWVRAVCICNTTALGQARDGSDIDFFIIVRQGAIWRTRFFSALPFKLLGLRPGDKQSTDPVCLSFFVTDQALNLSHLTLEQDDPYFRYWLLNLLPLTDDGVLGSLWRANHQLLKRHLFSQPWIALDSQPVPAPHVWELMENPITIPTAASQPNSYLEKYLKKLQHNHLPENIKQLANKDTRVVINDDVLKFHIQDRRQIFRERYYRLCHEYSIEP